jgi:hypothetical protein
MIIKNERDDDNLEPSFPMQVFMKLRRRLSFENQVVGTYELKNTNHYFSLRGDLIEYLRTFKEASTY